MTGRLPYEDFGHVRGSAPQDPIEVAREEGRSVGYDEGYGSGWEDAMRSIAEKTAGLTAELERNVADSRLVATDALETARVEAAKVLQAIATSILEPVLTDLTLVHVRQRLDEALGTSLERPVVISAAPATMATLRPLLPSGDNLTFIEQPTLADDQVILDIAETSELVDLRPILDELRAALTAVMRKDRTPVDGSERSEHE